MHRKAGDNKYLHKDFHGALSCGIDYLHRHYGKKAVREYLDAFTSAYYMPLRKKIRKNGLKAVKAYFTRVFRDEGGVAVFDQQKDSLVIDVKACPAICHMKSKGYPVSPLFCETTRIMNNAICRGTAVRARLVRFDTSNGTCRQIFSRRKS